MSIPFLRWRAALDGAVDDASKRSLLGEIGRWRAAHLIDVVGQRDAAYALVVLYEALGDKEAALREARSLASLCRTPPYAERQEGNVAEDLVARLSGKPRKAARGAREPGRDSGRDSGRDGGRGSRRDIDPVEHAVQLGHRGEFGAAFKELRGKGGPRINLIRAWLDLKAALDGPADRRDEALHSLLGKLEKGLPGGPPPNKATRGAPQEASPRREEAPGPPVTRVDKIVGRAVPERREKRLRILGRVLETDPSKADALGAALLLDHLDASGPGAGAPWLVRYVARAQAVDGVETQAALDALRTAGAVAVQAYDEPQYATVVALWKRAAEAGLELRDLRRGVLRIEPEERRIWTTRLGSSPDTEAMLAIAADVEAPYAEGLAATLAKRIADLSDHALLLAPGAGNAALREAAQAAGVVVVEPGADLLAAVQSRQGPIAAPKRAAPPAAAPAAGAARSSEPTHRERVEAVKRALFADEAPTAESLAVVVEPVRKVRDVLDLADELTGDDAEARLIALLVAVHRTAPDEVRLLQGTTLALRAAGRSGPDGAAAKLLTEGEVADRLGGPGMSTVLPVAIALQAAGWSAVRVLRGATRRERRAQPALDVLGPHLDGLWRIVVQRSDVRGEVWVTEDLPAEGRAAVPQLAVEPRSRVAVLADGSPLADVWAGLGGPEAITWSDGAEAKLAATLEGWTAG
jgi:hypothetical protein